MSSRPLAPSLGATSLSFPKANSAVWPMAAMVLIAGLHVSNLFGRAINWDEFYHYSQINELLSGTLTMPMQTLMARLFSWVPYLPGDNISHIIAARCVMFGFVLATAGATYALATGFASRKVALVCVLAWLSAGFVLQHGTSYRTDAFAAALLMSSLAMMTLSRLDLRASLIVAALAALAVLLTIKSALYAPAFAGIAWLRWQEAGRTREATIRLSLLATFVPVLFALFYVVHSSMLGEVSNTSQMLAGSADKMFQLFTFPYAHHAIKAAFTAPLFTLGVLVAPLLIWHSRDLIGPEKVALGGLWLPITTIAFYHNSAAYYYVFMLPPVAVACILSFRWMIARYSLVAISAVCALSALAVFANEERSTQAKQRQIVAAADLIFAEPVNYFDFPGMIGHFPKANVFLTPWGASGYLAGDETNSMAATMERVAVPLVLENDPMLTDALTGTGRATADAPSLRQGDRLVLRDTYIRFWGPYWVAGEALEAGESRMAEIRVPGIYTVRDSSIVLDGMLYLPGEVLQLDRGAYTIAAFEAPARLIWGDKLEQPAMPAPEEPYWTQF